MRHAFIACTVVATLAGYAFAAEPTVTEGTPTPVAVPDTSTPDGWDVSKLVGLPVNGSDGRKVGEVGALLLDRTGTVRSVIVRTGGLLGIGEREVNVPFLKLTWTVPATDAAGSLATSVTAAPAQPVRALIDMTQDELSKLPGYRR